MLFCFGWNQTKVQGRSKKDKGDDQEWEIFPDDGYEETWFPDMGLSENGVYPQ